MAQRNLNLLKLDIEKLFEDHKIEEIVEIEKILDNEIERKRVELRSMVGDRYKDVLAASDAIKSMKTISENIVTNIKHIKTTCEGLITEDPVPKSCDLKQEDDQQFLDERILVVQIRLAILMNEQIWIALDAGNNLTAVQFYLLAQHIHMVLNFSTTSEAKRLPILKEIRFHLHTLKEQITNRINQKLELVTISAEETSSNLNALLLLQNQTTHDLLNNFIQHRKAALNIVTTSSYISVRAQIGTMVSCLITTISLLHHCFIGFNDSKGLIYQQLDSIVENFSSPTLAKIDLKAVSTFINYIPDIIKEFRPKYKTIDGAECVDVKFDTTEWLTSTKTAVREGLKTCLNLVTSIKGLHLIRDEALKIELPNNWDEICQESKFPGKFNVWYYFFQELITERAKQLISIKIATINKDFENACVKIFQEKSVLEENELNLREYIWTDDDILDVSKTENKHVGLSMKTLGYSKNVVQLCDKYDEKFLEFLEDVTAYLYGREYNENIDEISLMYMHKNQKHTDRDEVETHLRLETVQKATQFTTFLEELVNSEKNPEYLITKSIVCARLLFAITNLCPQFQKCCCTLNSSTEHWSKLCEHFNKISLSFWRNWIVKCIQNTEKYVKKEFIDINVRTMISIFMKWDNTEIQEKAEEKVFKSQIKVPLKPSVTLYNILLKLNKDISNIIPQTLPKSVHIQYIEKSVEIVLKEYQSLLGSNLNQTQSLQFLFDVKFLSTFCIPRENNTLQALSQDICDTLRGKIDPFDLDVFYSYLQNNVKKAIVQSQVILGCLLPSSVQLANIGILEKNKDLDKDSMLLALSTPSIVFPMFSTFAHQLPQNTRLKPLDVEHPEQITSGKSLISSPKKNQETVPTIRSSAVAILGGLTSDWFS